MALSNFMPNLVLFSFLGMQWRRFGSAEYNFCLIWTCLKEWHSSGSVEDLHFHKWHFLPQNTKAIRKGLWYSKRWISLDFVAHHMQNLQNEIGGPNINLLRRLLTMRWLFSCSFLTVSVVFWKIEWGVADEVVLTDEWSGLLLTDVEEEEPELLLLMVTGWKVTEGPPSNWKQMAWGSLESILHL